MKKGRYSCSAAVASAAPCVTDVFDNGNKSFLDVDAFLCARFQKEGV